MNRLNFISNEDLKMHIKETIKTYNETLKSIDLKKFNKNIIDPIKLTFDSKVYGKDIKTIIIEEIARQRNKTNTNAIGYFHQNIFKYFKNCEVPQQGFDIIFLNSNGKKVYVEMKNKHNTMNSSSNQKTYMKMLNQILLDDKSVCYLVEIMAKQSQNIAWPISLDGESIINEKIRRVSIDQFYHEVTGEKNAFYQICTILPSVIDEILEESKGLSIKKDTVLKELTTKNPNLLKALYLLAFEDYEGF